MPPGNEGNKQKARGRGPATCIHQKSCAAAMSEIACGADRQAHEEEHPHDQADIQTPGKQDIVRARDVVEGKSFQDNRDAGGPPRRETQGEA